MGVGDYLGASRGHLGAILGALGAILEPLGAILACPPPCSLALASRALSGSSFTSQRLRALELAIEQTQMFSNFRRFSIQTC